jgi:hypothetical protein
VKLALFKRIDGGWESVWKQQDDGSDPLRDTYVRISEYQDVTFLPLSRPEVIAGQLRGLDAMIATTTQKFAQELDALKTRRAELLALTHETA